MVNRRKIESFLSYKFFSGLVLSVLTLLSICPYVHAGYCMKYVPKMTTIEDAKNRYLSYTDELSAVISPVVYIAKNPSTSANLLKALSRHKLIEVRMEVAKNRNTPSNVLLKLMNDPEINVRISLLQNPALSKKYFYTFAKDNNIVVQKALADSSYTPQKVLEALYRKYKIKYETHRHLETTIRVLITLARNPSTPTWILHELLYTDNLSIKWYGLAKNPSPPYDVLEKGINIVSGFQTRSDLPPELFYKIDIDVFEKPHYRLWVQDNPNIPIDILIKIYKKYNEKLEVVWATAKNPQTPLDILEDILRKGQKSALLAAQNPKISGQRLLELSKSEDRFIKIGVSKNPNINMKHINNIMLGKIVDGKIKIDETEHEYYNIVKELAMNENTPEHVLIMIAEYAKRNNKDGILDDAICTLIAKAETCFEKIVEYIPDKEESFIQEYDTDLRDLLAMRGMHKYEKYKNALRKRMEKINTEEERQKFLQFLFKSEKSFCKAFLASYSKTPESLLKLLSDDKSFFVKLELAKNKNTKKNIMKKLLKIKEIIVFDRINVSYD